MRGRSTLGDLPDPEDKPSQDVLRPGLYKRLVDRFGDVGVMHEGEAMEACIVPSEHCDESGKPYPSLDLSTSGEVYRVNCPFCYDTRKRLWINHMFGYRDTETRVSYMWLANCFNDGCPLRGNWSMRRRLYNMIYDDVLSNDYRDVDVVRPGSRKTGELKEAPSPGKLVPITKLPDDHRACQYVRSRGYEPAHLYSAYKVCYCTEADPRYPSVTGRIVVPVYMRGVLVGWQGRYLGTPPSKVTPKYYTMPGMDKGSILYNFDAAKHCPYVVVTEGVFDAWRYGPEAVCLFGCKASRIQSQLLVSGWRDKAIVCLLDGMAADDNQALRDLLSIGHPRVVRADLPADKDPDSCSTEFLRQLVFDAAAGQNVNLMG